MAGSRVAGEEGVVEEQHGNDCVLPKGVEDELASSQASLKYTNNNAHSDVPMQTHTRLSLLMFIPFSFSLQVRFAAMLQVRR